MRRACAGFGSLVGCLLVLAPRSAQPQADPAAGGRVEDVDRTPSNAADESDRLEEPYDAYEESRDAFEASQDAYEEPEDAFAEPRDGFDPADDLKGFEPRRSPDARDVSRPLPPIPADSTVSPPADIPSLPDVGVLDPAPSAPFVPAPRVSGGPRIQRRLAPLDPVPEVTEADLDRHLAVRAEALRANDLPRAQLALDLLEETRRALAVRNVVTASALLVHEARGAIHDGQPARAVRLAEAAGRLSPDLPAAHWMRVLAYTRHEASSVGRTVAGFRDFVLAWVRGFRNQVHLSVQVVLLGLVALLAAGFFLTVVQLVKYAAFAAHDIASLGPRFVGTGEVLILLVAIVALPLVVLASLPLSIAFALPMLTAYQTRAERTVSAIVILALAAAPWMLRLVAPLATLDGSPVDTLAAAVGEASAHDVEEQLRREADRRRDFVSAVVLAHRLRRRGDLEEAEATYRKALNVRPRDHDAQNNIGVIQYLRGRRDAARMSFKAAQRGGQVEPLLNLAVLSAEDGRFDEAKRLLERAKAVDASVVRRHQALDSSLATGQKLAEARLDDALLWATLFGGATDTRTAVARELGRPVLGLAAGVGFTVTLVVLLLGGLAIARLRDRASSGCAKCGLPARPDASRQLCAQCRTVFLSAVAVDPELRRKKERQVRRFQRSRRWLVRVMAVVAGAADVFGGRPVAGAAMLFVFCFAVAVALTPHGWGTHAWGVFVGDSLDQTQRLFGLGIAALMSLWSVGRALR